MKKNTFIAILFIWTFISLTASAQKQPNIIIYMADDIGYDPFGCTGNEYAQTPHIDKLAEEGMVFDRLYGTVSQCTPIRQELFSGLYPHNNGVLSNAVKNPVDGLKDIADFLTPLGYSLSVSGKVGCKIGEGYKRLQGVKSFANAFDDEFDLTNMKSFIEKQKSTNTPFCMYIGSVHGHHPWSNGTPQKNGEERFPVPEHYVSTPSTRTALVQHAAEVSLFDQQFGEVRAMIEDLEIADNTIVIVLGEHGIAMPRGKWSVYDKGNRSLGVVYWKGKIKPGRTNALAQYCDILPTLIDYAGGKAPDNLDGFSLRPVLEGKKQIHREFAYLSSNDPVQQWAIVEDNWKLVWSPNQDKEHLCNFYRKKSKNPKSFGGYNKMFGLCWSEWEEVAKTDESAKRKVQHVLNPQEIELYKIDKDYNEWTNLGNNPEYSSLIEQMHATLKDLVGDMTQVKKTNKK
jgi:arylsulfatase A-like enzyme